MKAKSNEITLAPNAIGSTRSCVKTTSVAVVSDLRESAIGYCTLNVRQNDNT